MKIKELKILEEEHYKKLDQYINQKIIDDYAIMFAEWLYKWDNTRLPNGNWIIKLGIRPYTSKEVLEIFKKEKGL